MSFTAEGNFAVTIQEAFYTPSKFGPEDSSDLVVEVMANPGQGVDGQSDFWLGELSNRQGRGNNADKTNLQLTLATLLKLGISQDAFFDDPVAAANSLVGKQTVAWVKKNDKGYYNVRSIVDSGRGFKRIDATGLGAKLRAMAAGGGQPTFAPQTAAAPQATGQVMQQFPSQPAPQAPAQPAFPQQQFAPAPSSPAPSPFG